MAAAPAPLKRSGWTTTDDAATARTALGIATLDAMTTSATTSNNVYALTNRFWLVGDSIVESAGAGIPMGSNIRNALGVDFVNSAVGGVTMSSVYTNQFLANTNLWDLPRVQGGGFNWQADDWSNSIILRHTLMVSNTTARFGPAVGTNYAVLSIYLNTNSGGITDPYILAINTALSNIHGIHYVDVYGAMAKAVNPTNAVDLAYLAAGLPPKSMLFDHIHPNTLGLSVIEKALMECKGLNGWGLPATQSKVLSDIRHLSTLQPRTNCIPLSDSFYVSSSGSRVEAFATGIWASPAVAFGSQWLCFPGDLGYRTNILRLLYLTTNSASPLTLNTYWALNGIPGTAGTLVNRTATISSVCPGGTANLTNVVVCSVTNIVAAGGSNTLSNVRISPSVIAGTSYFIGGTQELYP